MNHFHGKPSLFSACLIACFAFGSVMSSSATAQNGLDRLLIPTTTNSQDSKVKPSPTGSPDSCSAHACLIPNTIESADRTRRASHNQDGVTFTDPTGFYDRDQYAPSQNEVYPTPLGYGKVYGEATTFADPNSRKISTPGYNGWNPHARKDEYVFDGNDRSESVRVDANWNIYGLQTEDTIGHFDTLDGRRLVTPSNRVAVYAPRFGAVRKVDGVFNARLNQPTIAVEEKTPVALAAGKDESNTTKQHLAIERNNGSIRASGFIDQTRGVNSNSVTKLFGFRNSFSPYENLMLIKTGRMSSGESARLQLGLQSALVWEDDLGLQVVNAKITPVITKDLKQTQELMSVESEDGKAILRVTKIASKIAARAGEIVEFTIRFDNLSRKKIGNVTLVDNLTRRLEYVPNSTECSHEANFITRRNDGGSLMLRWEIIEPLEGGNGGIIRFKCRVR